MKNNILRDTIIIDNGEAVKNSSNYILTFSGKRFRPTEPEIDLICIEDIAHALSNICRFTGHSKMFYSVAEHCCWICYWLINNKFSPEICLSGLLHDSTEAYLTDIAKPLKIQDMYAKYRESEAILECLIFTKFNLPPALPKIVKECDTKILNTEMEILFSHLNFKSVMPKLLTPICGYAPEQAEKWFLELFNYLQGQLKNV